MSYNPTLMKSKNTAGYRQLVKSFEEMLAAYEAVGIGAGKACRLLAEIFPVLRGPGREVEALNTACNLRAWRQGRL